MQQPFQLLNCLLEIDEQLSSWRYRHMNMVHRMIGTRIGTGGSSGKDYLKAAADKHYIFREIAQLNSFLIERLTEELGPLQIEIILPDKNLIQYKEAMIMAFMGVLRWRQEYNVLSSVTGAIRDNIGGALWIGQEA